MWSGGGGREEKGGAAKWRHGSVRMLHLLAQASKHCDFGDCDLVAVSRIGSCEPVSHPDQRADKLYGTHVRVTGAQMGRRAQVCVGTCCWCKHGGHAPDTVRVDVAVAHEHAYRWSSCFRACCVCVCRTGLSRTSSRERSACTRTANDAEPEMRP